jgi:hypothetical protein
MPKRVLRFVDRATKIKTHSAKSILIRLPSKQIVRIMDCFWKDFNAFANFLSTYVPHLSSYTMNQKNKIFSCFVEEHFSPSQTILRERTTPDHIYLIVEGSIKLVSQGNPFTQKLL